MIKEKVLYSLGDITIVPSAVSKIRHRSECNVFYKNDFRQNSKNNQSEYLPIFVSPMASVINEHNIHIWNDNNLIPIVPRTVELNKRIDYAYSDIWAAFGLDEFAKYFNDKEFVLSKNIQKNMRIRALIDIANGHIKYMQDIIMQAKQLEKELEYDIEIMAGNVANPETYKLLSEAGADYVRCAVGTGSVCFIDGTEITLANGTKKKIENINIGDKVKTHNGEKPVLNVIRFDTDKELVTINNEITCTSEHKFYVINKADKNLVTDDNLSEYAYWIEAKKLDKNKHLLIKKY